MLAIYIKRDFNGCFPVNIAKCLRAPPDDCFCPVKVLKTYSENTQSVYLINYNKL